MILKIILCVQNFYGIGAMLFIANLLIETDSTVICVHCMLQHVCYEPFLLNCRFVRYLICYLVEFCVLSEIHASKTRFKQIHENLRLYVYASMFWEPVYKMSHP